MISFQKPSKLLAASDRYLAKQKKAAAKRTLKRKAKLDAIAAFQVVRERAYRRDGGCCRVLGIPLKLHSDNPFLVAHAHHVIYRSAGGTDDLDNILTVSLDAHRMEHEHKIDISGHANGVITIATMQPETGKVLSVRESLPVVPV